MHDIDTTRLEYEAASDAFEFEFEGTPEFEAPLSEVEEMELAAELLTVSGEAELDQFLGGLFKKVAKGIGKIAKPLGGVLKGIAKKALPVVGGAVGSFIPIPGVGTAVGTALGTAASKVLEAELEGLSLEDQEFEVARRFVRLASTAARTRGFHASRRGHSRHRHRSGQRSTSTATRPAYRRRSKPRRRSRNRGTGGNGGHTSFWFGRAQP